MAKYFASMAKSELEQIGAKTEPSKINATISLDGIDVFVDLAGFIDVDAESKRLEKEREKTEKSIKGKENKLSNASFVDNAPKDIVDRERESLEKLKEQLKKICLLYTSPSPRDKRQSRMPSSA